MKHFFLTVFVACCALTAWGQANPVLEQLKADPRKAYGTDYPYSFQAYPMTKAPRGYKPFYISHYARHGSRYYWSDNLYKELDSTLTVAHQKQLLTAEGEAFYRKFTAAKASS